jgi:hypothetical protein
VDKNTALTIVELLVSLVLEGIILSFVFMWIGNKLQTKNEEKLKTELNNIEKQNKFDFEQLQSEIRMSKTDIINQIKESSKAGR